MHKKINYGMAKLEILHFPDERLRQKAFCVEKINEDIKCIVNNMLETMYAENGIGLAATQVNIQKRIITIDISEKKDSPIFLINPVITKKESVESNQEGCLSVPDFFDTIERAKNIEFTYQNLHNETISQKAEGLLSICIQHEIDHLDGKLFIDYLSPLKQQRLRKKALKLKRYN